MTPDEIEVLKQEASVKINRILSDFSMAVNCPIKEVSLNRHCSYFKDEADAGYYIMIDVQPRPETMAQNRSLTSRMEMRVDDIFIATVSELAKLTHRSKAEVLRDALNLYYKVVNEYNKNGKGIVFEPIDNFKPIIVKGSECQ